MLKFIKQKTFRLTAPVIVWALALPLMVQARSEVESGLRDIKGVFGFRSRLANADNVVELIEYIIEILLFVAGALAVLFVIIGGYQYLTSAGNEEQAEKGKKTVINSMIGIVFVVLAWVIVNVIVGTISD